MIERDEKYRGRVRYVGFVEEATLAALYGRAAATIFFSRFEGFGFPMVEAFKLGCPVLYNSECEVLRQHAEGAAIAIDERSIEDGLPAEVGELFDVGLRAQRRERMAAVAAGYDWDSCAEAYMKVLEKVAP